MPNHCSNNLTLLNGGKLIPLIKEYIKGEDLLFNKIIPRPVSIELTGTLNGLLHSIPDASPNLKESYEKFQKDLCDYNEVEHNATGWYQWSVNNWGTKWDCYDGHIETDEGIHFQTAWAPPTPVIQKLSELIKQPLRLTYLEEGMAFCGEYVAQPDGKYLDRMYDDLDNVPEDLMDELGLCDRDNEDEE